MLGNLQDLKDLGNSQKELIRDAVERAREQVERAKMKSYALRTKHAVRMRDVRVSRTDDNGTIRTTRTIWAKQRSFSPMKKGEMKTRFDRRQETTYAKDPQGPAFIQRPGRDREQDRDKMPADLRETF